jgi:DNA repair protein RadC
MSDQMTKTITETAKLFEIAEPDRIIVEPNGHASLKGLWLI